MASQVSASNIDTLLFLRDSFARYATKTEEILRALEIELRRSLEEWGDHVQKARRQERECQMSLNESMHELHRCESSRDADVPPHCSYEKELVEKARRSLSEAQARLQFVVRGANEIQAACEAFQTHGRALRSTATQTAPNASSHMNALQRDVERHAFVPSGAPISHAPMGVLSGGISAPSKNPISNEISVSTPSNQLSPSMRGLALLLRGELAPPSSPDIVQIESAVQKLHSIPELAPEVWEGLPETQRIAVLGVVEHIMAEIQGRSSVPIVVARDELSGYGGYNPQAECISLARDFIHRTDVREVVSSIVHTGRHAYQACAIRNRAFHVDEEEVERWRINNLYYLHADVWGEKAYRNQPIEHDAFLYTEAVIHKLYGGDND